MEVRLDDKMCTISPYHVTRRMWMTNSSSWSLSTIVFSYNILCVATSSTSQNCWQLQYYHAPSNSPATINASFYDKSYHKSYSLHAMILCLHSCLVNCTQVHIHVCKATDIWLYYTWNSTNDASFLQVGTTKTFDLLPRYVNPLIVLLQQLLKSGLEKFHILVIY